MRGLRRRAIRWLTGLALLSVALGAGYWLWLRDSDLVAVREVAVRGTSSSAAPEIRRALEVAGRQMTTLNVREAELERAVAAYPVVHSVSARPAFPNGLAVTVRERVPVAVAGAAGGDVALSSDGVVLRGIRTEERLPVLATGGSVRGDRVAGRRAREGLRVMGAAPEALRPEIERVSWTGARGLVARARSGPKLIFGDGRNAARKWQVVVAVLNDPDLVSVSEIDVRVPDRPALIGELDGDAEPVELAPPGAAEPGVVEAPAAAQPDPVSDPAGDAEPGPADEAASPVPPPPEQPAAPSAEGAAPSGGVAPGP